MKVIYDDERDHYRVMAREAAALIKSAKDLARMQAATRDLSRQRVSMRNEMFRQSMTESQLEDFIRRKATLLNNHSERVQRRGIGPVEIL